jgi:hypothetical protein
MLAAFVHSHDQIKRYVKTIIQREYKINIQTSSMSCMPPHRTSIPCILLPIRSVSGKGINHSVIGFNILPVVPSVCICGNIRPAEYNITASNSTGQCQEGDQLLVPLFPEWSPSVDLNIAYITLTVYINQDVTDRIHCSFTLYSRRPGCCHFNSRPYLLYTVLCECNHGLLKA